MTQTRRTARTLITTATLALATLTACGPVRVSDTKPTPQRRAPADAAEALRMQDHLGDYASQLGLKPGHLLELDWPCTITETMRDEAKHAEKRAPSLTRARFEHGRFVGMSVFYKKNGAQVHSKEHTHEFNAKGRLITSFEELIPTQKDGKGPLTTIVRYQYDVNGGLVSKTERLLVRSRTPGNRGLFGKYTVEKRADDPLNVLRMRKRTGMGDPEQPKLASAPEAEVLRFTPNLRFEARDHLKHGFLNELDAAGRIKTSLYRNKAGEERFRRTYHYDEQGRVRRTETRNRLSRKNSRGLVTRTFTYDEKKPRRIIKIVESSEGMHITSTLDYSCHR